MLVSHDRIKLLPQIPDRRCHRRRWNSRHELPLIVHCVHGQGFSRLSRSLRRRPSTSPPVSVRPQISTSTASELVDPSSMLNTRLPSPLFMAGVGSLPEASIVKQIGAGTVDRQRASVIASSPCVSRIVAGPPLVSDAANVIVSAPMLLLARPIASRSERSPAE